MRGTPAREPYSPCDSRPGETEPSRRVLVSWSGSKDRATHTRAPFFQRAGLRDRPARTFSTAPRQRLSSQLQAGSCAVVMVDSYARPRRPSSVQELADHTEERVEAIVV